MCIAIPIHNWCDRIGDAVLKCLILLGSILGLGAIVTIDAYCLVDYLSGSRYQDLFFVLIVFLTTAAFVASALIIILAKEDYV